MILPVDTSELLEWIPHRPPMVWIDRVMEVNPQGGSATVSLKADGLYMSAGGLRPSSFIEFLAQAFGFIGICRHLMNPDTGAPRLKKAFLVAVRDADIFVEPAHASLQPGRTLSFTLGGKKDIGPVQLTDGIVTADDGTVVAKAHLKVYAEYED